MHEGDAESPADVHVDGGSCSRRAQACAGVAGKEEGESRAACAGRRRGSTSSARCGWDYIPLLFDSRQLGKRSGGSSAQRERAACVSAHTAGTGFSRVVYAKMGRARRPLVDPRSLGGRREEDREKAKEINVDILGKCELCI